MGGAWCMDGGKRNAYKVLVGMSEEKTLLARQIWG
jgi:hypothetical protein